MTGDLAWLRELDVPVSNLAARIGRSELAITAELERDSEQPAQED